MKHNRKIIKLYMLCEGVFRYPSKTFYSNVSKYNERQDNIKQFDEQTNTTVCDESNE